MLFVWAFGSNTKPSKANWAKAALDMYAILISLYIVLAVLFGAAFLFNTSQYIVVLQLNLHKILLRFMLYNFF